MFKTMFEAVTELSTHDHSFMTVAFIKEYCKPFGFNPKEFIDRFQDNRSEFKGLYVPSVKEGDWVEGQDASTVAIRTCHKLGVEYAPMYGRGSALRECCRALREHLTDKALRS